MSAVTELLATSIENPLDSGITERKKNYEFVFIQANIPFDTRWPNNKGHEISKIEF